MFKNNTLKARDSDFGWGADTLGKFEYVFEK